METILILVQGGIVQGVSATTGDIKIIVQDMDNLQDVLESGEGDCCYIEAPAVTDEAGIAAQVQANLA